MASVSFDLDFDTHIASSAPTTVNCSSATVLVGDLAAQVHALLRSDLTANVPLGATIDSATLDLEITTAPSSSQQTTAFRCRRDWNCTTATWEEYALAAAWGTDGCLNTTTDRDITVTDVFVILAATGSVTYDVSNTVIDAWDNQAGDWNVCLDETQSLTDTLAGFDSIEGTTPPQLTVTYTQAEAAQLPSLSKWHWTGRLFKHWSRRS